MQPGPGDPVRQRPAECRAVVQQPVQGFGDEPARDRIPGSQGMQPIPDLACHHQLVRHRCARYEDLCNAPATPHQNQATLLRPLPDGVTDLDHFRVLRHDHASGVIHEQRLVA